MIDGLDWIGLDWIGLDWIGLDWMVDGLMRIQNTIKENGPAHEVHGVLHRITRNEWEKIEYYEGDHHYLLIWS